jgi:hypothetical protein
MRGGDARSYRMAIVAEYLVNPDAPENERLGGAPPAACALLEELGYGLVVLPPYDFPDAGIAERVEYLVDDALEYRSSGYDVVVVGVDGLTGKGVWLEWIEREVSRRGADPLRVVTVPFRADDAERDLARIRDALSRHAA